MNGEDVKSTRQSKIDAPAGEGPDDDHARRKIRAARVTRADEITVRQIEFEDLLGSRRDRVYHCTSADQRLALLKVTNIVVKRRNWMGGSELHC